MKNIKPYLYLSLIILFTFLSDYSFSQLTVSIISEKATEISDKSITSTSGNNSNIVSVGKFPPKAKPTNISKGSFFETRRTLIEFDVQSNIPSNAIIISAEIKIFQNSISGLPPFLLTSRVTSPWDENSTNWSNQPNYSIIDDVSNSTEESGWRIIDVTDHVQKMVSGVYTNYGWQLRHLNEIENLSKNVRFRSDDYSDAMFHPKLEVSYYLPMSIVDAIIDHESSEESNDGSILPILTGGPGGTYTYQWYNTSGIMSGRDSLGISGLSYGWYGLEVSSSTPGIEPFYYAFLLGNKTSQTNIDFNPGPNFIDDAMVDDHRTGLYLNRGSNVASIAENWTNGGVWYDRMELIRFRLWIDGILEFSEAEMSLFGNGHNPLSRPNGSELLLISEDWDEKIVTFSNQPTFNSTILTDVPATTTPNQNSVLDISNFSNYWKKKPLNNFGMILKLDTYTNQYTRQKYHSSDNTDASKRPKINFTFSVNIPSITMEWDSIKEKGDVSVSLQRILNKVGPYHYFLSSDSLVDLNSTYSYLKDSIGMNIDSVDFFTGKNIEENHVFNQVNAGKYYVLVFDSEGTKILNQAVYVNPEIKLNSSTGLNVEGNIISATATSSKGFLDLNASEYTKGELNFDIDSTSYTSSEQYFGLNDIDETSTNIEDMLHGFVLSNNSVYPVKNNIKSTVSHSIGNSTTLSFKFAEGTLFLFADFKVIDTIFLDTTIIFKPVLGLKSGTKTTISLSGANSASAKKYKLIVKTPHLPTCSSNLGTITLKINYSPLIQPFTFEVNEISDDQNPIFINSGTIPTNTVIPISFSTSSNPLSAGIYEIKIYHSNGNLITTEKVYLGFETEWIDNEGYDLSPNTFSLERNNLIPSEYSNARSSNGLFYGETGWMVFTPKMDATSTSIQFMRFSYLNPHEKNILSTPSIEPTALIFIDAISKTMLFTGGINNNLVPFTTTDKIYVFFKTNVIDVYQNGQLLYSVPRNPGIIRIRANSSAQFDGYSDVITSFGCIDKEKQFAELKYELDGYYHPMKNGKINFIYNQEYNSEILNFKIYSQKNNLIRTNTHYPTIVVNNGKNYISLDVTPNSGCLGQGYFYLEVTNEKKEKQYLRFYNSFDDCTPSFPPLDPSEEEQF